MSNGLTYDELVDHIMNDKSIPNVTAVEDIVLDEKERSANELKPRSKPWETRSKIAEANNHETNSDLLLIKDSEESTGSTEGTEPSKGTMIHFTYEANDEYYKMEEDMAKKN
ncbi:hypothetical protein TPHA_0A00200 [Tetrapisispora phaffii CBS 4417]|uniref:Peroxisomal membrane protein PEX14-like KPWE domain-containing protein n=1 Tax=Tetrapisispora phaffii (strain ATCC 24235 / CBS 4417 / NBRC 1672 / NRRL Y-8282 / UCD 70-5) TaxID=1071381 RepID=G8BMH7_TETPH|nr:hypothetical protein TPHA_0A00200 [Tetrapisispora phaffii CBS 4417]CCE61105.1 hypothetical protein TPHA_0A00200 [Tetrapisispora phaffii CBS 4417]